MAGDDLERPLGVPETGMVEAAASGTDARNAGATRFGAVGLGVARFGALMSRRRRRSLPVGPIVVALLALCLLGFVGWAMVGDDPLGGEPIVVVKLPTGDLAKPDTKSEAGAKPETGKPAAERAETPSSPASGGQTVTIIDGSTGKRQEVTLPPAGGDGKLAAVSSHLLEATRHGQVPRIGLDGTRPSAVYARKAPPAGPGVRVALVVGGLGVSAGATAEAMKKLPGVVTFAFQPYGTDLDKQVMRARAEGHEVLLQIPMEPFEYPDHDPGPQTLLTSLTADQNIDRMHWAMSRFQGYVGVVNYMGSRFTSTETAIGPVLREMAKRGLVYVDDGSSPRSLAGQFAGANNLPFAKAAVVLDAVPSSAEMDRALARLETIAREAGVAVGIARALPLSIDRLAEWTRQAEGRGITLVPITAVTARAKQPS